MSGLAVLTAVAVMTWRAAGGTVFHEPSRVLVQPAAAAAAAATDLFGYSLLVRNATTPLLIVGAPTATSTHAAHSGLGQTGAVYTCVIDFTYTGIIYCKSFEFDDEGNKIMSNTRGYISRNYKNEMWLGAALADVNGESLVVCAPRWCSDLQTAATSHRLVNGMCYVTASDHLSALLRPLTDTTRQGFRPEYNSNKTSNYYAYGEFGFSVAFSSDSNWLLLGAPGLLQWKGSVVAYQITRDPNGRNNFKKKAIPNTYYSDVLQEDSYLGYSVETGDFEGNGETFGVAGAPRGSDGFGQVLIFSLTDMKETSPLRVKVSLTGDQLGSYFGSVLLVADVNRDGRVDLLVGAPLYANRTGDTVPYDEGVVYLYLNRRTEKGFALDLAASLTGSRESGARFGNAIAYLGDVDDMDSIDYPEIAIGAPWESNGFGAVYIYRGNDQGMNTRHVQRISSALKGFGYSIARGFDLDRNGCNDLVVGAITSGVVSIYRCSRSVHVKAEIRLPNALNLPENSTDLQAEFCIIASETAQSSEVLPFIDIEVKVSVDAGAGRALFDGSSTSASYIQTGVSPGLTYCTQKHIVIRTQVDLTRLIPITMQLNAAPEYPPTDGNRGPGVRLGDNSNLHASLDMRVTRDCGEDGVCQPLLKLHVSPLYNPVIPGRHDGIVVNIEVSNHGEPAYEACVNITLTSHLLRVPNNCHLYDKVLECQLSRPFLRRAVTNWTLHMDTSPTMSDYSVVVRTRVHDDCRSATFQAEQNVTIEVTPKSNITLVGTTQPNKTLTISRQAIIEGRDFDFSHDVMVTNHGPSDLPALQIEIASPLSVLQDPEHCIKTQNDSISCVWNLRAKRDRKLHLPYTLHLSKHGELLQRTQTIKMTTDIYIPQFNISLEITSELNVEPASPIWPVIAAACLGVVVIIAITAGLYKAGFFGRAYKQRLRQLKEDIATRHSAPPDTMEDRLVDQSETELEPEEQSREPSPLSDFYAVE